MRGEKRVSHRKKRVEVWDLSGFEIAGSPQPVWSDIAKMGRKGKERNAGMCLDYAGTCGSLNLVGDDEAQMGY